MSDPESRRMAEIQNYRLKTMQESHPVVTDMYVLSKVCLLLEANQCPLLAYLVYYGCTKSF